MGAMVVIAVEHVVATECGCALFQAALEEDLPRVRYTFHGCHLVLSATSQDAKVPAFSITDSSSWIHLSHFQWSLMAALMLQKRRSRTVVRQLKLLVLRL